MKNINGTNHTYCNHTEERTNGFLQAPEEWKVIWANQFLENFSTYLKKQKIMTRPIWSQHRTDME